MNARTLSLAASTALLAAAVAPARALACSEDVDEVVERLAWDATDVVVARSVDEEGGSIVVDAWRGALRRGQRLDFEEMAWFASPSARRILDPDDPWSRKALGQERMVFFLTRRDARPTFAYGGGVSTVWLHDGAAHAYGREREPGMTPLALDEAQLEAVVVLAAARRAALEETIAIVDTARRAGELARLWGDPCVHVRERARAALRACGAEAAPVLEARLAKLSTVAGPRSLLEELASLDGAAAARATRRILREDHAFWKRVLPTFHRDFQDRGTGSISPEERAWIAARLERTSAAFNVASRLGVARKERVALSMLTAHPEPLVFDEW